MKKKSRNNSGKKQRNDALYCKQVLFGKPVKLGKGSEDQAGNCELRIETLKNSLDYFQEMFSGLGVVEQKVDELVIDLRGEIDEIEGYISQSRESDGSFDLKEYLNDKAAEFEDFLRSSGTNLYGTNQLRFGAENDKTDQLLESIENKLCDEWDVVKKVAWDLYDVLIGAV